MIYDAHVIHTMYSPLMIQMKMIQMMKYFKKYVNNEYKLQQAV